MPLTLREKMALRAMDKLTEKAIEIHQFLITDRYRSAREATEQLVKDLETIRGTIGQNALERQLGGPGSLRGPGT